MRSNTVKQWTKDGHELQIHHNAYDAQVIALLTSPDICTSWYCGYVTVPFDVDETDELITIHGGVTDKQKHANGCVTYGFDCAHLGDNTRPETKDMDWLTAETERLLEQIIALHALKGDLSE